MSEQEQQEYKKETNKRPMYFNKPSNEFKIWLKEKDEEKVENIIIEEELEKQLITQEMEEGIQKVIDEEAIQKSGNLKREKTSLKKYFNIDTDKAKERIKIAKDKKRQANMKWQEEKSNQTVNNLISFVAKLNYVKEELN